METTLMTFAQVVETAVTFTDNRPFLNKKLWCCVGGGKIRKFGLIWRRVDARKVSFRNYLRWPIFIINAVDETTLSCNISQWRSSTVYTTYNIFKTTLTRMIKLRDQMFHLVSNLSLLKCLYKLCNSVLWLGNRTLFVSSALWLTNMPRENSVQIQGRSYLRHCILGKPLWTNSASVAWCCFREVHMSFGKHNFK